jgi:hypothetical protein
MELVGVGAPLMQVDEAEAGITGASDLKGESHPQSEVRRLPA